MGRPSRGRKLWWLVCDIAFVVGNIIFWSIAVVVIWHIAWGMVP